jgi:hypothetical protein
MKPAAKWLCVAIVGAVAAANGCAVFWVGGGAAVGAGAVAYATGELKSTQEAPLDKVWNATGKAVKDLAFTTVSQQKDAVSAKLIVRTAGDKKIEINARRVTDKLTEIRIRVGTFGDESLSRLVLQKIEKSF